MRVRHPRSHREPLVVSQTRIDFDFDEPIDIMVDGQRPDTPLFMSGDTLREGLTQMSRNYVRVRPWLDLRGLRSLELIDSTPDAVQA